MMNPVNGLPVMHVRGENLEYIATEFMEAVMINPELRALLVCPVDHAALEDSEEALVCTQCGRRYPIVDGIPDMVPEEPAAEGESG